MIVGVDFSLRSTGVCAITDGEAECITIKSSKEESWWEFPERVQEIARQIHAWAGDEPDQWALETPAFMAKGQLDRMFGGWWLLVDALYQQGWGAPVLVTPGQLKKYATGKGNAGKDEVLASVIRRYPDVLVAGNDQADALTLACIGAGVEGVPFEQRTKFQDAVVDSVKKRTMTE